MIIIYWYQPKNRTVLVQLYCLAVSGTFNCADAFIIVHKLLLSNL